MFSSDSIIKEEQGVPFDKRRNWGSQWFFQIYLSRKWGRQLTQSISQSMRIASYWDVRWNILFKFNLVQVCLHQGCLAVQQKSSFFLSSLKRFYVFIFRERGREGEREGEKHQCVRETLINCPSHAPNWEPVPEPRHVPWPGFEPTHWATHSGVTVIFQGCVPVPWIKQLLGQGRGMYHSSYHYHTSCPGWRDLLEGGKHLSPLHGFSRGSPCLMSQGCAFMAMPKLAPTVFPGAGSTKAWAHNLAQHHFLLVVHVNAAPHSSRDQEKGTFPCLGRRGVNLRQSHLPRF